MLLRSKGVGRRTLLALTLTGVFAAAATAFPPPPANDTPDTAQVLGSDFPVLIYGTTVLASNAVTTTSGAVPALDTVIDGPDVFYRIEPVADATYRFHLAPWQHAPLRSSERRFALYMLEDLGAGSYAVIPGAGVRAGGSARAVFLDVALLGGGKYVLGVDQDAASRDEADFTLAVDVLTPTNPDTCPLAEVLPSTLPVIRVNDLAGSAANDFTFTQSTGQCAVSGTTPTTAPGNDHVYEFTPAVDGSYAIELISDGFNPVIYVDDSCPPFFGDSCQGASDHSTGGSSGGKHEFVVVDLLAGVPYYIYVDEVAVANGAYTLIIDDAANYEVTEAEPNDTPATASAVTLPTAGGQLVGDADVDYWAVPGNIGDRVYAWVNVGGSTNSSIDSELRFLAADGATVIEYDDDDGEGGESPLDDLYFIYSTSSSAIAGAKLTSNGTHYLRVNDDDASNNQTISRYRMHVGVEPADRTPAPEIEPNDTIAQANQSGLNYFAGAVQVQSDPDYYAFTAQEGDHIFIAVDGDPERDSTGSTAPNTDPNAFHANLKVFGPDDDAVIDDVDDSNAIQTGGGDYPAQAFYFVARQSGLYKIEVAPQSSLSQFGPTETYELAIFINGEPPALAELTPPVLDLAADYVNDVINGTATDDQPNDTGICDVTLNAVNNLQLANLSFTDGDPEVTFTIELIDGSTNGSAVVFITDCAGNTAAQGVAIDVGAPDCDGFNFSTRSRSYMGDPIHVPDNAPDGATNAFIEVEASGAILDVNVTVSIDSIDLGDVDLYLISPAGTTVELVTDRMSSLAYQMVDTTFDDSASEVLPLLSSAAPYTGSWLPEDPAGLAQLIGEDAQGVWKLRVVDDASSEDFGQTLVSWSLDVVANFAGPEQFSGSVADLGDGGGIMSIALTTGANVVLDVDPAFVPGDQNATYLVSLLDPEAAGTAEVTVTDFQENSCVQVISLAGLDDVTGPANTGSATTALTYKSEVQQAVPTFDLTGITDTITVPESFPVGEVEVAVLVDTKDQGRNALKLTHNGETAVLVNRIGMDERDSVGNTKGSFDIYLDDDAPADRDIHDEPALGSQAAVGLYQPDARGEFYGNGITSDPRDAFLFRLAGTDAAGDWDLNIIDARAQGSTTTFIRRWALTLKNPCGAERYVGTAKDLAPGTGIASIALAGGATNLTVIASFTPGDAVVDYRVELVDPSQPGSGTLEITDGASNVTAVPIVLAAASSDTQLPLVGGAVVPGTGEFAGSASDVQAGDSGISSIGLAPYADNLEIVSITPTGPGTADFVVGLVDPLANGRGYVRVVDGCGHRGYALVQIDGVAPACSGLIGQTKRYFSGAEDLPLPDGNLAGVTSDILVTDTDAITDVDITLNINHGFDGDIDLTLISPLFLGLFSDRGSTGNDFIDTTLDDEASAQLPTGSTGAPFTGSWIPSDGSLSTLDGNSASGTYTLQVVDDKTNDFGVFRNWSLLIESATFVEQYDGRAEDGLALDSGVCTIELLPGATNLTLTVDPAFVSGDAIVRYTVTLTNPRSDADGVVRVTDCAGNSCEVAVALRGVCLLADLDGDEDIDATDYQAFRQTFGRSVGDPLFNPACDFDHSGAVGLLDFGQWMACYREYVNNPLAAPPVISTGESGKPGAVRPGQAGQASDAAVDPARP